MHSRNHFTPFINVDDPGTSGQQLMTFHGEGKQRAEVKPRRFFLACAIAVALLSLMGACALAGDRALEIEARLAAGARV